MRFIIFSHAAKAYGPIRFCEEAEKLGLESQAAYYSQISFEITEEKGIRVFLNGEPLPKLDLVIFRSAGGIFYYVPQRDFLLSTFENNGAVILNKNTYKAWSRLDKLTQHLIMSRFNLPFVDSFLYGEEQELEKKIFYPAVVKVFFGSQGKKVFKVDNKSQLDKITREFIPGNLLIEPLLPNAEDVRVIVIGGWAVGAMKRIAQKGSFLSNYSQGAKVENFPLDKKTKELAEKAAVAFDLEYGGIDLMKDSKGDWKILEVNRACQFQGFEEATGINVAKITLEYMLSKV